MLVSSRCFSHDANVATCGFQWNVAFYNGFGALADTVYELLVALLGKLFLRLLSQSLYSLKYG